MSTRRYASGGTRRLPGCDVVVAGPLFVVAFLAEGHIAKVGPNPIG